jgi:hypothetical protein
VDALRTQAQVLAVRATALEADGSRLLVGEGASKGGSLEGHCPVRVRGPEARAHGAAQRSDRLPTTQVQSDLFPGQGRLCALQCACVRACQGFPVLARPAFQHPSAGC